MHSCDVNLLEVMSLISHECDQISCNLCFFKNEKITGIKKIVGRLGQPENTWDHRVVFVYTGMGKFRIDQEFLIEQWHMMYIMSMLS